jgi:hypothetical protein
LFLIIVNLENVLSGVELATGNVTAIFKAILKTRNTDCNLLILTTFNTVDKLHSFKGSLVKETFFNWS